AGGILFDGTNIWVTDYENASILRLDTGGNVVQTVPVGTNPEHPLFDGANIWIPNSGDDSLTVVNASTGAPVATLTGNGLDFPYDLAFDGERVLVVGGLDEHLSLWNAADLTPLPLAPNLNFRYPIAACSDGVTFFVALEANGVIRF